jgi:AraC-like DNA-binding protein
MDYQKTFSGLVRIDGHLTHQGLPTQIRSGFKYIELEKDEILTDDATQSNYILLLLDGELLIGCNGFHRHKFCANQMLLIPKASIVKIKTVEKANLLVLLFEAPHSSSDNVQWTALATTCKNMTYTFRPIPIRQPLPSFIEVTIRCLQKGMDGVQPHEVMASNFFFLLRGFYSMEEIAELLYPIVGKEMKFKEFIIQNHTKVDSLNELIALSNLGRTTFFGKFKEEFGMTAKQWMLRRLKERILWKVHEPGVRVKELMAECNFESQAQFYRYFKQQFHCTPKQLIQRYQRASIY